MVLEAPLYMQAKTYSAQQDRQLLAALLSEGVLDVSAAELQVTQRGAGANMSVDISAGRACITGDDAAQQGAYLCRSTAVENLPIGAAPGANSRIDLVLARVRDASVTGGVSSDWILYVLPGTAAPSPIPAAVPASAILLAQVLVSAGTTAITNGMITDRRVFARSADRHAPRGQVARTTLSANATGIAETPVVVMTVAADLVSGRRYKLTSTLIIGSSTTGDEAQHLLTQDGSTVAGANVGVPLPLSSGTSYYQSTRTYVFTAGSTVTVTFRALVARRVGSGTLTAAAPDSLLLVEDVGA